MTEKAQWLEPKEAVRDLSPRMGVFLPAVDTRTGESSVTLLIRADEKIEKRLAGRRAMHMTGVSVVLARRQEGRSVGLVMTVLFDGDHPQPWALAVLPGCPVMDARPAAEVSLAEEIEILVLTEDGRTLWKSTMDNVWQELASRALSATRGKDQEWQERESMRLFDQAMDLGGNRLLKLSTERPGEVVELSEEGEVV